MSAVAETLPYIFSFWMAAPPLTVALVMPRLVCLLWGPVRSLARRANKRGLRPAERPATIQPQAPTGRAYRSLTLSAKHPGVVRRASRVYEPLRNSYQVLATLYEVRGASDDALAPIKTPSCTVLTFSTSCEVPGTSYDISKAADTGRSTALSTRCSRSVPYKADGQQIELPGHHGHQREKQEQPGTFDY